MHYTTSPTTWPHQTKSAPRYTKSALHQAKSTPHQSLTSRTSQHRRDLVEIAMLCRVHTGLPEPDLTQHMSLTVLSTGSSLRPGPTSLVASWNLISIWGELFKNGDRISNVRQDSNEQWAVHATIIMFPYHKYQSKIKNSYLSNSNFTGTSPAWILSERILIPTSARKKHLDPLISILFFCTQGMQHFWSRPYIGYRFWYFWHNLLDCWAQMQIAITVIKYWIKAILLNIESQCIFSRCTPRSMSLGRRRLYVVRRIPF